MSDVSAKTSIMALDTALFISLSIVFDMYFFALILSGDIVIYVGCFIILLLLSMMRILILLPSLLRTSLLPFISCLIKLF